MAAVPVKQAIYTEMGWLGTVGWGLCIGQCQTESVESCKDGNIAASATSLM